MKKILLMLLVLCTVTLGNVYAQSRKVTGKVIGADDGAPLPGVSVSVKGTARGVITDGDGRFVISVSTGETLQFTFIGYTTTTVPVTGANDYSVKMPTNSRQLEEVVVTDGYTVQAKKAFTGSSSSVSGAENENKPFATPQQALQGELAGVAVTSASGQPGANVQIRIRGLNSVALDANPLYVVDGMIINSGNLARETASNTNVLAGLNEDDIESITVLKDAAATAIYGSRGGNGVIVITTKRGKAGKTQVEFDAEAGTSSDLPLPAAGKPLNGAQYSSLFNTGLTNAGVSAATLAAYDQSYGIGGPSNYWYDLVTKRGTQEQYNVSINGGGDNTRVFSSLGYFKQDATTIGSNLTRITGLLNIDHNISKRISISTNLNVSNIGQNTPYNSGYFANPVLSAYFLRPEQIAYTSPGVINSSITGNTNFSSIYNPLWTTANDVKFTTETHMIGGETIKWNIIDNLKFTSFASTDYDIIEETQYLNPIQGDGHSTQGSGTDLYTRYFNWLTRNQLNYRYDVKGIEDFYVDATVGYEAQKSKGNLLTAYSTKYPLTQPLLTALGNAATPVTASDVFNNYTFDSFYAIGSANYKNLVSLSGSFRRDGSSRFGANKPYGNFSSIGGAVNIDGFDFFKNQQVFSSLKVRSSIGTTGNAGNNSFNYTAQPTAGYGFNYAGTTGQNYNTVGNPDLTWESQRKFDIGADFGFFKDRLVFDIDYYKNTISGLIAQAPIAQETGFTTINENIGTMVNKGVEASVKGIPIRTKDFTWSTNFNISFNANTIEKTATAPGANGSYFLGAGTDYFGYYVKQYAGVDPANGNALWFTDGTRTATTTNYSAAKYVQTGQADPKLFGGWNNTFNYKGFTLAFDFYYNFGNKIYDSYAQYLNAGAYFTFNKYQYVYENSWTTPGQKTDVPKYVAGGIAADGGNDGAFSTRYFYYGDFIRLKNASLGYNFKNIDLLKKLGVRKLYLYARATNLLTKTYDKRLPFDPEVNVGGFSNIDIPQIRTATLGLNVGF
jgi:TonB-linked SusC/RagA family outer membrane protein